MWYMAVCDEKGILAVSDHDGDDNRMVRLYDFNGQVLKVLADACKG